MYNYYRTTEDLLRSFALNESVEQKIAHLTTTISNLEQTRLETETGMLVMGRIERLLDEASELLLHLTGR